MKGSRFGKTNVEKECEYLTTTRGCDYVNMCLTDDFPSKTVL